MKNFTKPQKFIFLRCSEVQFFKKNFFSFISFIHSFIYNLLFIRLSLFILQTREIPASRNLENLRNLTLEQVHFLFSVFRFFRIFSKQKNFVTFIKTKTSKNVFSKSRNTKTTRNFFRHSKQKPLKNIFFDRSKKFRKISVKFFSKFDYFPGGGLKIDYFSLRLFDTCFQCFS